MYFVHGYHVVPDDPSVIAAETDYGRPFVSSIRRENIMATQFHPEKSQKAGLKILANFAGTCMTPRFPTKGTRPFNKGSCPL